MSIGMSVIKKCLKAFFATFFLAYSVTLACASKPRVISTSISPHSAKILEAFKSFYETNITTIESASQEKLQEMMGSLFEASSAAYADPMVLDEVRKHLENTLLRTEDVKPSALASPGTVQGYKILLNLIQKAQLKARGRLSPRSTGEDSGSLVAINIHESIPWQALDSSTKECCQYYSLFHALCAVAERERIDEPGLEYGNDKKFRELKTFWASLMATEEFMKIMWATGEVSEGTIIPREEFEISGEEPTLNFIIEKICKGQGGVSARLGAAFKEHIALISHRLGITTLFHSGFEEGHLRAMRLLGKGRGKFTPGEIVTHQNIEKFRTQKIDYIVIITTPTHASSSHHALTIILDRIAGSSQVKAEVCDSELPESGETERSMVKKIYYELFDNPKMLEKIEELRKSTAPSGGAGA